MFLVSCEPTVQLEILETKNLMVWLPRHYVVILVEFKFGGLMTTIHRRLCIAWWNYIWQLRKGSPNCPTVCVVQGPCPKTFLFFTLQGGVRYIWCRSFCQWIWSSLVSYLISSHISVPHTCTVNVFHVWTRRKIWTWCVYTTTLHITSTYQLLEESYLRE